MISKAKFASHMLRGALEDFGDHPDVTEVTVSCYGKTKVVLRAETSYGAILTTSCDWTNDRRYASDRVERAIRIIDGQLRDYTEDD